MYSLPGKRVGDFIITSTQERWGLQNDIEVSLTLHSTNDVDYQALEQSLNYMVGRKVIVPCEYCKSANAWDNPTCVQCGAPMGKD